MHCLALFICQTMPTAMNKGEQRWDHEQKISRNHVLYTAPCLFDFWHSHIPAFVPCLDLCSNYNYSYPNSVLFNSIAQTL